MLGVYQVRVRTYFLKDKETKSYEEFCKYFFRKLSGVKYEEGIFDAILNNMYHMDDEYYKLWLNEFSHINLRLFKDEIESITKLTENQNNNLEFRKQISKSKRAIETKSL